MAGIGFELNRLVAADRLSSNLRGLVHATWVSSGPWLFTCMALVAMGWLGREAVSVAGLQRFSILVSYNFSFSLVLSGPIVLVVTRCLADAIHARDGRAVPGLFMGALVLLLALHAVAGALLYGVCLELATGERLLAFAGLLLTSGLWLVATFLSALKSYAAVSAGFALGLVVAAAAAALTVARFGTLGLLASFCAGLATVFFVLAARILAEFPGPGKPAWGFLRGFRRYWELALVGLLYNAAIWVDKWVLWFAPGAIEPGGGLRAHPTYESAMFLAYLSVVPATALFLIAVETRFYAAYVRFYRDIAEHATLKEIRTNHARLVHEVVDGLRRIGLLQAAMCALCVAAAPRLIEAVGGGAELVPVFRFGVFGALFHMLLLLVQALLAYLDLRRELLAVTVVFFVANLLLTLLSVWLGPEYHGHGYALAAWLSFAVGVAVAAPRLARLPYLSFIANNGALRRGG